MKAVPSTHPSPEQLAAFVAGKMNAVDSALLEGHLTDCDACQVVLEALPEDTLMSLLRPVAPGPAEPTPRAVAGAEKTSAFEGTPLPEPSPGSSGETGALPASLIDHPRYRVGEMLGAGGMGVVYRAEHRLMDRPVALKIISRQLADRPEMIERFRREVKAAARLSHPNIVHAYDAEQAGPTHFLVMEYVEGTSLDRLVRQRGPLPVPEACDQVCQAALGLQHAFEQGMVHRDIKPHNLMRTPQGQVKILDFGLAHFGREVKPEEDSATAGTIMGTPDYLAPEQARDAHSADIRADLYSLGCTLYFLLAGRPPFPDKTALGKIAAHLEQTPPPLTELRHDLPPGLVRVVEKLMAKDPAQRYQTPAEAAQALAPFTKAGAPPLRRWVWIAATVLLGILGSAGYLFGPIVYRTATNRGKAVIESEGSSAIRAEPLPPVEPGTPLNAAALVSHPATLEGVRSWTLAPVAHPEGVEDTAYSPDGKLLATGCRDGSIRLWDPGSGRLVRLLVGPSLFLSSLAWSPDNRLLAAGSREKTVCLWEAATGRLLRTMRRPASVICLAWSPDGKTIACGEEDGMVRLVEAASSRALEVLQGHSSLVRGVTWSGDGRLLASGSSDGTIRLWEVGSATLLRTLGGHEGGVDVVAFASRGKTLASGGRDSTVRLWEVETGRMVRALSGHQGDIRALAWAPDGATLASAGTDHLVRIWETESGRKLRTLEGHTHNITSLSWSPEGSVLASGSGDTTARLWRPASGQLVLTLPGTVVRWGHVVLWSVDGKRMVSGSYHEPVEVWDSATGRVLHTFPERGSPALALSPDGKKLASAKAIVTVLDVGSGEELRTLEGHTKWVRAVVWSPDGKRLASAGEDGRVCVWDSDPSKPPLQQASPGVMEVVAWSPDSVTLASGGTDGFVKLWEPGRPGPQMLAAQLGAIQALAWSPDGKMLASGHADRLIRLWDPRSGKVLRTLSGLFEPTHSLTWSPDSRFLAGGAGWGNLRIWEAATGKVVHSPPGHTSPMLSAAWSPDGTALASADEMGTVRLWDPATGRPRANLLTMPSGDSLAVNQEGHYRGSVRKEEEIVYIVQTEQGQEMVSPREFRKKYGWKNDPDQVRLTGK
jgi:WD40 repeat protein